MTHEPHDELHYNTDGSRTALREAREMTDDAGSTRAALERDREQCRLGLAWCCTRTATEAHHIVGRSVAELRHEPLNLLSVCPRCHGWVESNPGAALEMIRNMLLSAEEWRRLSEMARRAGANLE